MSHDSAGKKYILIVPLCSGHLNKTGSNFKKGSVPQFAVEKIIIFFVRVVAPAKKEPRRGDHICVTRSTRFKDE